MRKRPAPRFRYSRTPRRAGKRGKEAGEAESVKARRVVMAGFAFTLALGGRGRATIGSPRARGNFVITVSVPVSGGGFWGQGEGFGEGTAPC